MGRCYASLLVLSLIFGSCYATSHWTTALTQSYSAQLEEAQTLSREENWEEAGNITKEVYDHWNSQSFWLYVLLRHSDIDKISLGFQTVCQYLEQEDVEPYVANNAQLITQLQLLSEMEQLSWENVL